MYIEYKRNICFLSLLKPAMLLLKFGNFSCSFDILMLLKMVNRILFGPTQKLAVTFCGESKIMRFFLGFVVEVEGTSVF